ncbi:MAG: site-specific DNA-methyltransferase [Candidatus Binataceae bacterium]
MAKTKSTRSNKRPLEQYAHPDKKRVNNPPVGLVTPETDQKETKRAYAYDPHLDPSLQWAGKAERASFEVPTASLHVHERIDPRSILEAVRKKNGNNYEQLSLFSSKTENPPLREAIEFYKHAHGWSNRLIAGDSLLVMNSLLEKEGMAGHVQMVYFDPPYGIKYGSNFQPFVNRRDVKDGKDEDLTAEPEMIKAFRDTWELGIHSYLTYLRDRLKLVRELLNENGSIFVQISDENVHHVREIMDEVFGPTNFISLIAVQKTTSASGNTIAAVADYLIWYARDSTQLKFRSLFLERAGEGWVNYDYVRLQDGTYRRMSPDERTDWSSLPKGARVYRRDNLTSQRPAQAGDVKSFPFEGREYRPGKGTFKTDARGLEKLREAGRLEAYGETLSYRRFANDFPYRPLSNLWTDTLTGGYAEERVYVVQTVTKIVQRCLLMTTDPGDLVLDITCGSGTTAVMSEQWGRRWITCDTSRVATTLAKQRLMTSVFDYYQLARPEEGVGSGFRYKTVPHVTLKSIANNEQPVSETLYDQPIQDAGKIRVTGPFTVEAVPAPTVRSFNEVDEQTVIETADNSIARSGATLRQDEWTSELLRTGVRGKAGQRIEFSRLEPLPGTRYLNADAETKGDKPQRVVVSFGPEHAPLEQRQVALALEEAQSLVPKPKMILFAAFQFDPEASKDIDETNWPGVTLLKAQMNADLLTEDLKKKRSSNESFWLIGQPDVKVKKVKDGEHKDEFSVSVEGFDYYNTKSGTIESGGVEKIAMWLLDTDYDGRSLFPRQVFFPMAGDSDGWAKLAKNLHAEIDEDLIETYRGTEALPFPIGKNKRVAVKIIDDRGIESLRILDLQ